MTVVVGGCSSQVAGGFSAWALLRKNILHLVKGSYRHPGKQGEKAVDSNI